MEPLTGLGRALEQLRAFAGLSLETCAERIGVPVEDVRRAEQGELGAGILEGLARLYAIDLDSLSEGVVRRTEDSAASATVFLLQGPYQDFDARDLDVLCRAMTTGRRLTADGGTSQTAALGRRLALVPTATAGPMPADAARQGYKLARAVRRALRLGGEPLPSLVSLLEPDLGIAVVEEPLVSDGLRAASIVDAHRSAAAAVLNANDLDRQKSPVLARVYLAHELCHILFDPCRPGTVRLALDDHFAGRDRRPWNEDALLESRAKGFAAELLLPEEGLLGLLGPKHALDELSVARDLVHRARNHFGTPGEIAVYHLANLGFIRRELRFDLIGSLPSAIQSALFEPDPDLTARRDASPSKVGDADTLAKRALHATREMGRSQWRTVLEAARTCVDASHPIEASDRIVQHLDELLCMGDWVAAKEALAGLDPKAFPPQVLTAVLTVTLPARDALGDARAQFVAAVKQALLEKWSFTRERVSAIEQRLG